MEKILYLMRHGETEFNVRKKIQGWCDSPLTEVGIQQARIAGTYFSDNQIEIDHAYSSTSERASDTLEIVTGNQMPYQRLKGLKEWNFGAYEGESEYLNPPIPYGDFFEKFGGESEEQMRERVASTLKMIMGTAEHQNVSAVSHGASCRGFMRRWAHNQQVDQKARLKNCCILKFIYTEDEFHLVDIINHDFSQLQKQFLNSHKAFKPGPLAFGARLLLFLYAVMPPLFQKFEAIEEELSKLKAHGLRIEWDNPS